jgi:hypothetical protein
MAPRFRRDGGPRPPAGRPPSATLVPSPPAPHALPPVPRPSGPVPSTRGPVFRPRHPAVRRGARLPGPATTRLHPGARLPGPTITPVHASFARNVCAAAETSDVRRGQARSARVGGRRVLVARQPAPVPRSRRHRLATDVSESGRPGSNRRRSAWKADALPTELLPRCCSAATGKRRLGGHEHHLAG